jgi:phosphoribosyl 1,2-cyclic phosphodiesterase/ActR/RegA family two-component response regulator
MGKKKFNIYLVDEDPLALKAMTSILEKSGNKVSSSTNSKDVMDSILMLKPDCVICDIIMPGIDGFQLCKLVTENPELINTRFIMVSAKVYEFDQKRSFSFGAHGYIRKPIDAKTFSEQVSRILDDHVEIRFWGVRGTLPASGEHTLKYGGNTSCISLEFPRQQLFVFDGGSGIKALGDWLISQKRQNIHAKILISHPHWDHINAIPFFAPLYRQGNEFEILGSNQGDSTMRELISAQMDGVYFPITLAAFAARVYFHDLDEENIILNDIEVKTMLLSHPGKCLGYRVNYNGRSLCYITDNEMFLEDSEFYSPHYEKKLQDFCRNADALITDSTYSDFEYESKVGWGHSCISKVVNLAHNANVKSLYLFHHDPDQTDSDIDAKLEYATSLLSSFNSKTAVIAPCEGQCISI